MFTCAFYLLIEVRERINSLSIGLSDKDIDVYDRISVDGPLYCIEYSLVDL